MAIISCDVLRTFFNCQRISKSGSPLFEIPLLSLYDVFAPLSRPYQFSQKYPIALFPPFHHHHLHHHYHYLLLLLLHDVNDITRIGEPEGRDKTNKNRRLNNNVWHVVRELSKLSASCLPRLHFSRVFPVVNGIEKRRKLRRNDRSLVTVKKEKRKGNSRRPDCQMHVQQRRDLSPGKRKLRRRYSYNISTRRLFIYRLQIERRDVGFERR